MEWYKLVIALIVVLVLLVMFYSWMGNEYLGQPYFLTQMAMAYSDPVKFNYLGYERDVSGMSSRDYYLENQMNASTHVGPQYLEGDTKFVDNTGYMSMPIKYRPLRKPSATAAQKQSELVSNNMEEYAYQELNQTGHY